MTNAEIAAVLEQTATLLEFQGANLFRVRAYRNAARTIGDLPQSVADIVADPARNVTDIDGIGKDLAEKVTLLVHTHTFPMLEELLAQIPAGVLAILRVPGLGPKRAAMLHRELGVTSLEELRSACEAHRVRELSGFGEKTEATILQGIDVAAEADQRILWAEADQIAQQIRAYLARCATIQKIEIAGSYRRGKETVGDLDVLIVAGDVSEAMGHFAEYPDVAEVLARGDTKMTVRLANKLQVDLRAVPAESFGAALQYFTGSQAHNIALRSQAKDRGLKINEYGVFEGDRQIAGADERDIYATLGLPCFPPELREARREFQWAEARQLPVLIELQNIRGDLHSHTTWTDGTADVAAMADAARRRGLEYLAITDHSKRVTMVGGLDAARFRKQWREIDRWNQRHREFTLLKGVEVDILEQGGLDLDDDVLAEADWVVASVHFGQNQSRQQITTRVLEALANPYVSAIAHPTGRLLMRRKPYEIDLEAVFKAAAEHGKFLELNAHPTRLDLDDVACAAAKDHGVGIVISTDAHSIDGLDAMRYGVQQARRGGLTALDVVNTQPWPQLKKRMRRR